MAPWISASSSASSRWPGHVSAAGRLFSVDTYAPLRAELEQIRQEVGAQTIEQVVYAWVMMLPSQPLPLIGSGKRERIAAAVAAESIALNRQQWFRIRKAALGYDVP